MHAIHIRIIHELLYNGGLWRGEVKGRVPGYTLADLCQALMQLASAGCLDVSDGNGGAADEAAHYVLSDKMKAWLKPGPVSAGIYSWYVSALARLQHQEGERAMKNTLATM